MYRRYDTQPGTRMADHYRDAADANRAKTTYTTRDIWQAAYIDDEDIALLDVQFDSIGRAIWTFLNVKDLAWQTGKRFRDGVNVEVEAYRRSYKRMATAVKLARSGRQVYGADLG